MEDEQDMVPRLRALGLSEYAARAYLALLKLGKSDAKSVSALARVPPSKIYDVLGTLEDAGLLEVFAEFPKKYGPLSLERHIDRLVSEHRESAERIAAERSDLLRAFAPSAAGQPGEEGGVVVTLRGRTRIMERLRGMLQGTQSSWLALSSLGGPARLPHVIDEIRAASARGVAVRVLLPMDGAHPQVEALAALAEVRPRRPTRDRSDNVALFVSDGRRAMLVHWGSDSGAPGAADSAIVTDDEAMVSALESLARAMWDTHAREAPVTSSA